MFVQVFYYFWLQFAKILACKIQAVSLFSTYAFIRHLMVLLPSMHILTQFKNATSGEERQMVCQALLARHAQGGGMTVVAEQERRGGGK